MSAVPRNLLVLRVDDDLPIGLPSEPYPVNFANQLPPPFLDPILLETRLGPTLGMKNWASAIGYWKAFQENLTADLIVSDVQFIDPTSPLVALSSGEEPLKTPSGLGHFKLFALMARMRGGPIGVALHTADPQQWQVGAESHDPIIRAMSYMAAHEIGELAALVGDAEDLPQGGAAACWAWLQDRTAKSRNHRDAVPIALRGYRKQLRDAKILPADWAALVSWCGGMVLRCQANPKGLTALTEEDDKGIAILRPDGVRDLISMRSIFADVPLLKHGLDFDYPCLPEECFDLVKSADFDALTPARLPKIGGLVAACDGLHDAYLNASRILEHFPCLDTSPKRLANVGGALGAGKLAIGLALLFLEVRVEYHMVKAWERLYESASWAPETDAFVDEDGEPLRFWLQAVYRRARGDGPIDLDDVAEVLKGKRGLAVSQKSFTAGAIRCVELLKSIGSLSEIPGEGLYEAVGGRAGDLGAGDWNGDVSTLPVPSKPLEPPANFYKKAGFGPAFFTSDGKIRDWAGIRLALSGYNNYSVGVTRIVDDAFSDGAEHAVAFLQSFTAGEAPVWIKELCRTFANDEGWTDARTWAVSFR
jgi:hypothetical protein